MAAWIEQIFPLVERQRNIERLLTAVKLIPGFCTICSSPTLFFINSSNLREAVPCTRCKSINRKRQVASTLIEEVLSSRAVNQQSRSRGWHGLSSLSADLKIWNTEIGGALNHHLKRQLGPNLTSSEFLSPRYSSGTTIEGKLHVDICDTQFEDEAFDFILSSDVLEHVPDLGSALAETHRILKVGGSHIFTVPFFIHRSTIQTRAVQNNDGNIVHHCKPWYHLDPLRPEGTLCFRVLALELITQLEAIGFTVKLLRLHSLSRGLLGSNGYVFVATKTANSPLKVDPLESLV